MSNSIFDLYNELRCYYYSLKDLFTKLGEEFTNYDREDTEQEKLIRDLKMTARTSLEKKLE